MLTESVRIGRKWVTEYRINRDISYSMIDSAPASYSPLHL
jgi:hypothetical protein